jgi:arylamine N-acetyltransferase
MSVEGELQAAEQRVAEAEKKSKKYVDLIDKGTCPTCFQNFVDESSINRVVSDLEAGLNQEEADGRVYRLRREYTESDEKKKREYWILQQFSDAQWESLYRFTLQPHTLTDFTERCHYHQTSPESHFTQKRICSMALPMGRISLSELRLITTIQSERKELLLTSQEEYFAALAEHFGIVL